VPLATETGLLDALNARLPPALEPLASWTRTGKVELRAGDVGSQHWWSSRVTQAKAASLLKAATGRDVPRFQGVWAGKAGGWLSPPPPPVAGQGVCLTGANYSTLPKRQLGVPLLPADFAGRPRPCAEGRQMFSATTPCNVINRDSGIGTMAHKPFSARSLPSSEFTMTARWTSPEIDAPS